MEKEIIKAVVVRDIDMLRIIFMDASKGNVYVKADLLRMVGAFIKNNSL